MCCRRSEVLKWLQKRKDMLPDYPLHVCEWCDLSAVALLAKALHRCVWLQWSSSSCRVAAEMSSVSKKRLKYVRSDTITASSTALRDILDAPSNSSGSKMADMCMDVLVQRVMIPHENFKEAEEAIREYSSKLSPECKTVCCLTDMLPHRQASSALRVCCIHFPRSHGLDHDARIRSRIEVGARRLCFSRPLDPLLRQCCLSVQALAHECSHPPSASQMLQESLDYPNRS